MTPEFDIQLNDRDLFRFNMRQNYLGKQGPISIIIAVICAVAAVFCYRNDNIKALIIYCVAGLIILLYIPITLRIRSKQTLKKNEVLAGVLHYAFTETGVRVTQGEETGELPYDQIYKAVATKKQLLLFSNRINAYIVPRNQIEDQYDAVKMALESHVDSYRLRMK